MSAGFALREAGAYQPKASGFLFASTICIFAGTPCYAAVNYLTLSRALYYTPFHSPLHPGRASITLLGFNNVCGLLNGVGAGRMVKTELDMQKRQGGADLLKAGLVLLIVTLALSTLLAAELHRRVNLACFLYRLELNRVLTTIYVSCALITGRCLFYIVELSQGVNGFLATHEAYFWIFDASIMFLNTAVMNVFHPGMNFPSSDKEFLARDGGTKLYGPGWKDNRHFLLQLFDWFDLTGLINGRDKKTRFWELPPSELNALRTLVEREEKQKKEQGKRLIDPFGLVWKKRRQEPLPDEENNGIGDEMGNTDSRQRMIDGRHSGREALLSSDDEAR